jgi:hypothetical protein
VDSEAAVIVSFEFCVNDKREEIFSGIPISVAGENLWKWCPYFPGVLHKNADLNWTSFNVGFCFCNCHHMHFASEIQSQPCFLTSIVANGVAGWRELPVRFLKVPAASVCASPQTRFVKLNNACE